MEYQFKVTSESMYLSSNEIKARPTANNSYQINHIRAGDRIPLKGDIQSQFRELHTLFYVCFRQWSSENPTRK